MVRWGLIVLGLIGAILNLYRYDICFVLWTISNIGLVIFLIKERDYGMSLSVGVYTLISGYGMWRYLISLV